MVIISEYELRTSAKDGRIYVKNKVEDPVCPVCGRRLEYRDMRKRVYWEGERERRVIYVRRLYCRRCGKLHVELPNFLEKNKRYRV